MIIRDFIDLHMQDDIDPTDIAAVVRAYRSALGTIAQEHTPVADEIRYLDGDAVVSEPACSVCGTADEYPVPWPCDTIRAVASVCVGVTWQHEARARAEFNIALRALSDRNRQLARCRKVAEAASAYIRAVDRGSDVTAAYGRLADGVREWRRQDGQG